MTCNRDSPLGRPPNWPSSLTSGPEVVAGSTRMKAGTAEKMVLNMLSTGAMVRLGYVYGNLMVNLHRKNSKLAERWVTIVQQALECQAADAVKALKTPRTAFLCDRDAESRRDAVRQRKHLRQSSGHVRNAVSLAKKMQLGKN